MCKYGTFISMITKDEITKNESNSTILKETELVGTDTVS